MHVFTATRRALPALAALSFALLVTGCALQGTAPEGTSFVTNSTFGGRLMGGDTPVVGSTLNLYAVGTTGYGTGATLLATTTTGSNGAFSFNQVTTQTGPSSTVNATYGCPSNSTLLYLVGSSGDSTSAGTPSNFNTNIKLLDAIGPCSGVASNFYDVNEVANVISVAALQQYINPSTEQIGSPSTTTSASNQARATTGIANAFAAVAQMLNYGKGTANTTFSPASNGSAVVTATLESAKIYTIANIISACINTTGSSNAACTTLKAAATIPQVPSATNFNATYTASSVAATDTLQATLFMLQNPTDAGTVVSSCAFSTTYTTNLGCLYAAQTASSPYTGLSTAPSDWTIGATYASASTQTISSATVGYLNYPQYLAIDKSGDIWVTLGVTATATPAYGSGLTELSPQGGILQQVLNTGQLIGPRTPAFDPAGNIYVPNFGSATASNAVGYGTTVVKFPANGTSSSTVSSFTVGGCPYGAASDGAGNIFVGECSTSVTETSTGNGTPGSDIREIPAGAASGTTASVLTGAAAAGYAGTTYSGIAVDSNFTVWATSGGTNVFAIPATSSYSTGGFFAATDPEPIAIDSSNDAFVANYSTTAGTLDKLTVSGTTISNASGAPFTGGGLNRAELMALDGAGNSWITNYVSGAGSVSELSKSGTGLSPSTGGFAHTYAGAYGIAVDPSGNVWVGNNVVDTHAAIAASTTGGGAAAGSFLTEIIGAAVPVITPIAAGLPATAGGTSTIATPPQ